MRVSNIGISTTAILGLQHAVQDVEDAQRRAQSGLRVEKVSDDPNAAASILSSSSSLRALDQYQRNIGSATVRINTEEEVLNQLTDSLARAKQLGIQEGSGTANAQSRLVAKAEVDQILAFAVQLANTKHEGEYLFGGDQSSSLPITQSTAPFTTTPPTGRRQVEIGEGLVVTANHNASDIFLNSNVLAGLDQLSTALGADDQPGILNALNTIDTAITSVNTLLGEVGSTSLRMETATANISALDGTLRAFKSNLQDVDLEQAVTQLITRQNAYQAAMLATSKVLGLSLADYIR